MRTERWRIRCGREASETTWASGRGAVPRMGGLPPSFHVTPSIQAAEAWKKYTWLGPCDWPWGDSGWVPWDAAPLRLYTPNTVMTRGGNFRVRTGGGMDARGRKAPSPPQGPSCTFPWISLWAALGKLCRNTLFISCPTLDCDCSEGREAVLPISSASAPGSVPGTWFLLSRPCMSR